MGVSGTFLDAKFTKYSAIRAGPDGNRFDSVPKWSMAASADYSRNIGMVFGTDLIFLGHVDLSAYGPRYWDEFESSKQESYHVVDASVGLQAGAFRIRAYAENLFDEEYFTNFVKAFQFTLAGSDVGVRGQEQRFGVEVEARF